MAPFVGKALIGKRGHRLLVCSHGFGERGHGLLVRSHGFLVAAFVVAALVGERRHRLLVAAFVGLVLPIEDDGAGLVGADHGADAVPDADGGGGGGGGGYERGDGGDGGDPEGRMLRGKRGGLEVGHAVSPVGGCRWSAPATGHGLCVVAMREP